MAYWDFIQQLTIYISIRTILISLVFGFSIQQI